MKLTNVRQVDILNITANQFLFCNDFQHIMLKSYIQ